MANCVHGSKHLGQELINNLRIFLGIQFLRNEVNKHGHNHLSIGKKDNLIGKSSTVELSEAEMQLLNDHNINAEDFHVYYRAKIYNSEHTSRLYEEIKTNDYTVRIEYIDGSVAYGAIKYFFRKFDGLLYFLLEVHEINCTNMIINTN